MCAGFRELDRCAQASSRASVACPPPAREFPKGDCEAREEQSLLDVPIFRMDDIAGKIIEKKQRCVRFEEIPLVRSMHVWPFAARAAQIGLWETHARDREHFSVIIKLVDKLLEPVLHDRLKRT